MKFINKKNNGFTLIETLIYIGLFTILIGGVGTSAYSITESSSRNSIKALLQSEGDFLVGKINWALTGIKNVTEPAVSLTSGQLSVTKWDSTLGTVAITLNAGKMKISCGGLPAKPLNNEDITVSDLLFIHKFDGGANPESVTASFTLSIKTLNGMPLTQEFSTTNYLRK